MRRAAALALIGCGEPCPRGDAALRIEQLELRGPVPGESTLVTTPEGRTLLIDVGNDSHDGDVRAAAGGPVDYVLITHGDEDHRGGLDDLADVAGGAERITGLGTWDIGGATLEVFLADGALATPAGEIDLRAEVPDLDGSENARSLAGVIRYGDFTYLFAGDLTGGGKGTPDVESAVARRALRFGRVDVLHLSHHGIRSSTNAAWVEWLLPADGADTTALVGANRGYLAAPSGEVMDRIAPRLGAGQVWTPRAGLLAPAHDRLREVGAAVQVEVAAGGASYAVCGEEHASAP